MHRTCRTLPIAGVLLPKRHGGNRKTVAHKSCMYVQMIHNEMQLNNSSILISRFKITQAYDFYGLNQNSAAPVFTSERACLKMKCCSLSKKEDMRRICNIYFLKILPFFCEAVCSMKLFLADFLTFFFTSPPWHWKAIIPKGLGCFYPGVDFCAMNL